MNSSSMGGPSSNSSSAGCACCGGAARGSRAAVGGTCKCGVFTDYSVGYVDGHEIMGCNFEGCVDEHDG